MPTLALSTIVRDAALSLPACLESVRGIVDEMVIADTGSTDETIEIALGFRAQVIPVAWTDDFAAARNKALAPVKSDWVLVLDADEQLDPSAAQHICALIGDQSMAAYQVPIRSYVSSLEDRIWDRAAKPNDSEFPPAKNYPAYVEHESIRLFRHLPEIFFVGRVHERIDPQFLEAGLNLGQAPFCIHHFGLVSNAETRARKNHFYRRLGRAKLRETPQDAQAYLELGVVELDDFGNLDEALALFVRACELNPRMGVAWLFRGLTLSKLRRLRDALRCLSEAERQGHLTSLVYESQGDAHYHLKEYPRACENYDRAVQRNSGNPLLQSKLGLAIVRAGNTERGLGLIRQAVECKPAAGELHDRLILSLVWLDRIEQAGAAAEAKLKAAEHTGAVDFLRAASLWARLKNWPRAAAVLQVGLQRHPNDITLGRSLSEVTRTADVPDYATAGQSNGSER
jgi:glycosyltransferase involved in cell wall biosynthesis